MNWSKITLKPGENQDSLAAEIGQLFDALYLAAGCPGDMALFERPQPDGTLELYLSPVACHFAAELMHGFNGQSCDEPAAEELELVDGHIRAWHMPESGHRATQGVSRP